MQWLSSFHVARLDDGPGGELRALSYALGRSFPWIFQTVRGPPRPMSHEP